VTNGAAALQKPVRLGLEVWAGKPQRGDLTKPGQRPGSTGPKPIPEP
jgi:hypothetical protein